MIKFRYKRKESSGGTANATTAGSTVAASNGVNSKKNENNNDANVNNLNTSNNSIGDHKLNDVKGTAATTIDTKTNSLKRDTAPKAKIGENKSAKTKSISDDEYLADCIQAVVVSQSIFFFSIFSADRTKTQTKLKRFPFARHVTLDCFYWTWIEWSFCFAIISGIISTVADELRAGTMSRSIAPSIGQWTVGRSTISVGLLRGCGRMFRAATASRALALVGRRNGQLQPGTVRCPSKIRDASGGTKRLRMRCQFGAIAIHTGKTPLPTWPTELRYRACIFHSIHHFDSRQRFLLRQ